MLEGAGAMVKHRINTVWVIALSFIFCTIAEGTRQPFNCSINGTLQGFYLTYEYCEICLREQQAIINCSIWNQITPRIYFNVANNPLAKDLLGMLLKMILMTQSQMYSNTTQDTLQRLICRNYLYLLGCFNQYLYAPNFEELVQQEINFFNQKYEIFIRDNYFALFSENKATHVTQLVYRAIQNLGHIVEKLGQRFPLQAIPQTDEVFELLVEEINLVFIEKIDMPF